MFNNLPSLQALRALEAAARLQSFTRAAEELHLTHSAVSHQIRALEGLLDCTLFTRVGARMAPTAVCERLASQIRSGLGIVAQALAEIRADACDAAGVTQLTVSVVADIASAWLIKRLDHFYARFPHIDLTLQTVNTESVPDPYSADVGIWFAPPQQPGFNSVKLLDDWVIAVASPQLMARFPDFEMGDFLQLPLLRFSKRPWRAFLEAAGLPLREPTRGPMFDDSALLIQAAVGGQGVCTARMQLARDLLASGQLVQVGSVRMPASMMYFIVWREHHPKEAAIAQFRDWLLEIANQT